MAQVSVRVSDVWWATVPFGERVDGKKRPVIVLGWRGFNVANGDPHFLVVPSYTFDKDPSQARESDLRVKDWKVAGLMDGSFIRCARVWSLAAPAFDFGKGRLGVLDHGELVNVLSEVGKMFQVQGSVAA